MLISNRLLIGALRELGWTEDRHVAVDPWVAKLEASGQRMNKYSLDVLASLGGLTLDPWSKWRGQVTTNWKIFFDPLLAGEGWWERWLGTNLSPLGECTQSGAHGYEWALYIASDGRLFGMYDQISCFGNDFEDSLSSASMLICPTQWHHLRY